MPPAGTASIPAAPTSPAPKLRAAPAPAFGADALPTRGLVPQAVTALRTAVLPSFTSAIAASSQPR